MKVTDVQTYLVNPSSHRAGMIGGKNWLFVRIRTDNGLTGWGECYTQLDRDRNIERMVHDLGRYLVGRDPLHIRHFLQFIWDDFCGRRGSMDLFSAQSGIEQALWDIAGKNLGQPVYNLLGGPMRERARVYANGWYGGAKTPDEYGRMAAQTVSRGFTALKFDPFPGPWRLYVDREVEERAIDNVRAVREAVGPNIDLLIEVHRRLAPMHAVRVALRMEQFRIFWYEEPVPAENPAALAEVRREIDVPVVTGETLYTRSAFLPIIEHRAADILNPDVCSCGGILELTQIADMAAPHYIAVAPHNYNSTTIGLAATLQAAATMSNFCITEYFLNFEETSGEICDAPFRLVDGQIPLPTAPGLGISLDERALTAHAFEEQPLRSFPVLSLGRTTEA